MHTREGEWLATGDIAERQATGDLKFLGRKSELIVTAAGVNIHPEDLEGAIEQEPGIAGCAVVPIETPSGPEAFAVIAVRGALRQAAEAVVHANEKLAEFQRVRRWAIWPEPDLPRTSTGKVRRKTVAEWVADTQSPTDGRKPIADAGHAANEDWLLALIAATTGETPSGRGDDLRLSEDLYLDSLARLQLAAALEERLGALPESHALDEVRTLGELRRLIGGEKEQARGSGIENQKQITGEQEIADKTEGSENSNQVREPGIGVTTKVESSGVRALEETSTAKYIYPHWPWWAPVRWIRALFLEAVAQPLVWLLANPLVVGRSSFDTSEPMLVIGNHVTAFDGPLVQYALPGHVRRRMTVAMAGEMLEDYRHFRNPERVPGQNRFMLFGPLAYLLVTALYNVFPLPRGRNFQRSFAHAGEALDGGLNVMVFPEGTRSEAGQLARFRPGIGLLVKQAQVAVLPVAIRGLGELKSRGRGWFRSGKIEVHVGEPLRFTAQQTEAEITVRLHSEVQRLLGES
jgi:long-chain acyl-CoA synthetase